MGILDDDGLDPPAKTPGDVAYESIEAALPLMKWVRDAPGLVELLSMVIGPPYQRRMEEWCHVVTVKLRELGQRRGFELKDLASNPEFADILLTATQAAARTSTESKRQALRNCVLNAAAAVAQDIDVDLSQQQIFLAMTSRFTELHLLVLWTFAEPTKVAGGDSIYEGRDLLEKAIPGSKADSVLFDHIYSDLYSLDLVRVPKINNGMEGGPHHMRRTTDFGRRYIAFITEPE